MSTVVEAAMNPAEFENLANRTILWKSQKRVGGKRTDSQETRHPFDIRFGRITLYDFLIKLLCPVELTIDN